MAEVTLDQVSRKVRDLYNKAFSAMERNNIDYACDMFLGVLELEPRLLVARKYLRLIEVKKYKAKKVSHSMSSFGSVGKKLSIRSALKKNPLKALRMVEDLMLKDPANLQFLKVLDEVSEAAGMPEIAIQAYEMVREFYAQDVNFLNRLGKLYMDHDDPVSGRSCYEAVARLKPNDQQVQRALKDAAALATMKKGNWDKEGSFRDKMKDAKEAAQLEQRSKVMKSVQDVSELMEEARAKIEEDPANINYRRTLAELYVKNKDYGQAIEVLEQAQQAADAPDPQVDLAISEYRLKAFDQEIEQLQAAGEDAAAEAKAIEKEAFQFEEAQACAVRYPNDLLFAFNYGELLYLRGEMNDAIQQFQKSQRNAQRRILSLYYLALCFEQKGQLDIALEQLQKAASELPMMDDTKKDILYEMGGLSEKMGNTADAIEHYKQIYAVDIGYKDIATRIEASYGTH